MIDLTRHPRLLRVLSHYYRVRAWAHRRHVRSREADAQRGTFYEQLWREAAGQLGATIEPLGYDFFEIRRGGLRARVWRNYSALDDPVTLDIAGNKSLVYRLLTRHGLRPPSHVVFDLRDMGRAVTFLKSAPGAVVVKPANGTGAGRGVTTGITTTTQLARAAASASAHGRELLIEEQATGDNYRLLYLDGHLLDAVRRRPPSVVGDGKSSVSALLQRANAERLRRGPGQCPPVLTADLDMLHTLAGQGLSLGSVPTTGAVVTLKTVINQNLAEDNITCTHLLCDSVIRDGARAAQAVGVRLAGIDIVTPDPGVPLVEAGGVILEVNTTPGYHHHYGKPDGSFPVAVHVLSRLLGPHERDESPPEVGRSSAAGLTV